MVRRSGRKRAPAFANHGVSSSEIFSGTVRNGRKNERRRVSTKKKRKKMMGSLFLVEEVLVSRGSSEWL